MRQGAVVSVEETERRDEEDVCRHDRRARKDAQAGGELAQRIGDRFPGVRRGLWYLPGRGRGCSSAGCRVLRRVTGAIVTGSAGASYRGAGSSVPAQPGYWQVCGRSGGEERGWAGRTGASQHNQLDRSATRTAGHVEGRLSGGGWRTGAENQPGVQPPRQGGGERAELAAHCGEAMSKIRSAPFRRGAGAPYRGTTVVSPYGADH